MHKWYTLMFYNKVFFHVVRRAILYADIYCFLFSFFIFMSSSHKDVPLGNKSITGTSWQQVQSSCPLQFEEERLCFSAYTVFLRLKDGVFFLLKPSQNTRSIL